MSDSIRERAYAKLTLSLRVTGKSAGYHLIEALQQSLDLYDDITLTKREDSRITSDFAGDNSLVVLSALQKAFRLGGMHLSVKKRIPIGGGLGGSSADAAAAALSCAKLYGISRDEVYASVKELFGDIAFQMTKGTAIARGMGSEIEVLPDLPRYHVLLLFPEKGVSTKEAYALADDLPCGQGDVRALYRALFEGRSAKELFFNDLYHPATLLNDEIAPFLLALRDDRALLSGMSGSGSTLFSLYKTEAEAKEKAASLPARTLVTETFSPSSNGK
ncbi:MAG: hypothetical protein J6Y74_06160 [Clostridia bacterium]|nr:hypothetical protein [Clostridia bacterium]